MKRGGQLARTTPLGGRTGLRRARRRSPGTTEQREQFHRATLAGVAACPVTDDGDHDGPLQAHHVITQEAIKAWASDRDLDVAPALWDPRNGLAICRRHHDRHTLARRRLPAKLLTATHRAFAHDLGLERLLEAYR